MLHKCRLKPAFRLLNCCIMNNLKDTFTFKMYFVRLICFLLLSRTYSTCLYSCSVRSWSPVTTIHRSLYNSLPKKCKYNISTFSGCYNNIHKTWESYNLPHPKQILEPYIFLDQHHLRTTLPYKSMEISWWSHSISQTHSELTER